MEKYESLIAEKHRLEQELQKISRRVTSTTPWAPGVTDQFHTESREYTEYTDPQKAQKLMAELKDVEHLIDTYAMRAREEQMREKARIEAQKPKYGYVQGGEQMETTSMSMAARYNAQARFFGMSKLKQTLAKVNGQWRLFQQLWIKAVNPATPEIEKEVTDKLNKMFR